MAGSSHPRGREGFVAIPGGRVWYRVVGGGDGVPLLTVHGGPGYPHDYLKPLEALAEERPLVFYDQLGCGRSDRPEDPRLWHLERFVEELRRVQEGLRLEAFHLLGHSWGSMVATDFALGRPEGLVSLVLASPCLDARRWVQDQRAYRAALPAEVREVLDRHEAAGTLDSREYRRAVRELYGRHMCRLDPIPEAMRLSERGFNPAVYATMWGPNEFTMTGSLASYHRTDRLREISVPALFTCGRHDECPPRTAAWYRGLFPGSELAVFEESSHMPHLEETQAYLQVVGDFLRRWDWAR